MKHFKIKHLIFSGLLVVSMLPALSYADALANCPSDPTGLRPPCEGGSTCTYTRQTNADSFMTNSSTHTVDLTTAGSHYITFSPVPGQTTPRRTGFIFIHGGGVDTTAYSGYSASMAQAGYPSANILYDSAIPCTPTPPNTSNTASAVDSIIAHYGSAVDKWVIAGHSLGTTLTDYYIRDVASMNPKVVGFAYLAGYTFDVGNNDPLPNTLSGLLILGGKDGILTWSSAIESAALYPDAMAFRCIAGGNHGQFGWYGPQANDNPATITEAQQHQIVITDLLAFMGTFEAVKAKKSKPGRATDLTSQITACQGT